MSESQAEQPQEITFECQFAPKEQFEWWEEGKLIGQYVVGNTYNCSRFDVHAKLRRKLFEWAQEGKVTIMPLGAGQQFLMQQTQVQT